MNKFLHVVSVLNTEQLLHTIEVTNVHKQAYTNGSYVFLRLRDTVRGRGLRTTLQVFPPCNYYAGVATTSNAESFRSP